MSACYQNTKNSATLNYHNLLTDIRDNGHTTFNKRTGKNVTTVLNRTFTYDRLPYVFTKKVAIRSAVAEMLGYLKGLSSAADFRSLGTKTWDANANAESWQSSEYCSGEDDMGRVYGVQGRSWRSPKFNLADSGDREITIPETDQLYKLIDNLKQGNDDRGEILTFWNPGEFDLGCLRPCMHTHQFSLLGDTLFLTSYQRSADVALGLPFNMLQCWFLLSYVAWLTGKRVGTVTHHCTNLHIYEDQWEGVEEQLGNLEEGMGYEEVYFADTSVNGSRDFRFYIPSRCAYLHDLDKKLHENHTSCLLEVVDSAVLEDFFIPAVRSCGPISFPFSV